MNMTALTRAIDPKLRQSSSCTHLGLIWLQTAIAFFAESLQATCIISVELTSFGSCTESFTLQARQVTAQALTMCRHIISIVQ